MTRSTLMPGSDGSIRNALTPLRAGTAGAKHPHDDAGEAAVRAPLLATVQHVAVAVALGGRAQRDRVRTGVGFGQREAGDDVAGGERRQPAFLLLARAESCRIAEQIIECTETVTAVPASTRASSSIASA